MIIGLTGRNAGGKGTVAAFFQENGFAYTSLSDAIRTYLAQQGLQPTRDQMIATGRQLRQEGGPGVLAAKTLETIAPGADCIVDSVRNPAEVTELRKRPDFILLDVQAGERTRYQRLRERARAGDAVTFEEFQRQELAELQSGDTAAQQLLATADLADIVVPNDGDIGDLHVFLEDLLGRLRKRFPA